MGTLGVNPPSLQPVQAPGVDPNEWAGFYRVRPNRFEQFAYLDELAGVTRVRWAARGAAAGAIIGEVADDDAGKGAAIGATAGVVAGGRQSRKNQQAAAQQSAQQQQQATQQTQAANQQQLDLFKKGFAACLEPNGYTVK